MSGCILPSRFATTWGKGILTFINNAWAIFILLYIICLKLLPFDILWILFTLQLPLKEMRYGIQRKKGV